MLSPWYGRKIFILQNLNLIHRLRKNKREGCREREEETERGSDREREREKEWKRDSDRERETNIVILKWF